MNMDQRISYAVSLKLAGDFMMSEQWQGVFETDDLTGELFALADSIYEGLAKKTNLDNSPKESKSRSGGKSGASSSRQASQQSGSNRVRPRDPEANASPNQIKAIKKMLEAHDLEYDNKGVDLNNIEYEWDTMTMNDAQVFFDELGK